MSRRDLESPNSPRCSGILVLDASGIWIANGTAAFLGLDYCRFLCQGYELSVRVRKAGSSSMTAPKYPRLLTVAQDAVSFSIYRVPSYRNRFRFIWRREKAKEKLQGEGSLPCVSVVRQSWIDSAKSRWNFWNVDSTFFTVAAKIQSETSDRRVSIFRTRYQV